MDTPARGEHSPNRLERQPLQGPSQFHRARVAGWLYAVAWAAGVLAAVAWLDGGARIFVLILLALVNPAGAWGVGYARYRRDWEEANAGGLADADSEHTRVLDDGRVLRVAHLPEGAWQAWLEGTAPLSGNDESLVQAIWAALGHEPPHEPAPWMFAWAREIETSEPFQT